MDSQNEEFSRMQDDGCDTGSGQEAPETDCESNCRSRGIIKFLVLSALICSWCAAVLFAQTTDVVPPNGFVPPRSKPSVYYLLHALGILSALSAGAIAAWTEGYKRCTAATRKAFWVLEITAVAWGVVAYGVDDYLSWQALGATGPVVWLSCLLVFAGMERELWKAVGQVIRILAYLTGVLALFSIASSYHYLTERWLSAPVQYMVLLMWFGGWTFLTSWECTGWRLYLRYFPYLVFVIGTVVTQTRSWFLMSIFLLIARLLVLKSAGRDGRALIRNVISAACILLPACFLLAMIYQEPLLDAYARFAERATEDTRSEQYVMFFSQISLPDLILGGGPKATWDFGSGHDFEQYQFFDNVYLWMAFLGGLPLMLSYMALVIVPGVRAAARGVKKDDAAAATLLVLWGLACAGFSTYVMPSLSPYSYFLCLLAGRCHAVLEEGEQEGVSEAGGSTMIEE
jgi:hypothetical protein